MQVLAEGDHGGAGAGADDTNTPVPVMQRPLTAAREPKGLRVVPGAGHGGYAAALRASAVGASWRSSTTRGA